MLTGRKVGDEMLYLTRRVQNTLAGACPSFFYFQELQMETIKLVPSWAGVMPCLLAVLQDGNPEGREVAREELMRMAKAADMFNKTCNHDMNLDNDIETIVRLSCNHVIGEPVQLENKLDALDVCLSANSRMISLDFSTPAKHADNGPRIAITRGVDCWQFSIMGVGDSPKMVGAMPDDGALHFNMMKKIEGGHDD
jgi:hypothetical protein